MKYLLAIAGTIFLINFLSIEFSALSDWQMNRNAYVGMIVALLCALAALLERRRKNKR